MDPLPPPLFKPSGRNDDTYRVVNTAYPPSVLVDAINEAMKQMHLVRTPRAPLLSYARPRLVTADIPK